MRSAIEHWEEWRSRCAIARCGAVTAAALRGFAWLRFQRYARAVLREDAVSARLPSAEQCWMLLEAYLSVARPRSGRRYKEWLFARLEGAADDPLNVIQGGASLLLRDVVREHLRQEVSAYGVISLDAPAGPGLEGVSLHELLPAGMDDNVLGHEREQLADGVADRVLNMLSDSIRLILLAKELHLPLYHPVVLGVAGVGRSRASELWRSTFNRLADDVRDCFPGEPPVWHLRLALAASARLGEKIFLWGRAEKMARPLFLLKEEAA